MPQGAEKAAAAPSVEPPAYPGSHATVGQVLRLADAYCGAAYVLLKHADGAAASAPARLCALHAVESYLNAYLAFHDIDHNQVRGLQHNMAQRTFIAVDRGLRLRAKTQTHLLKIQDQREYLVVRYAPEQLVGLSEINRMFATLREVSTKVRAAILRPGSASDPSSTARGTRA